MNEVQARRIGDAKETHLPGDPALKWLKQAYERIRNYILEHHPQVKTIFEIGAGWGFGANILSSAFQVTATDNWPPFVEYCRKHFPNLVCLLHEGTEPLPPGYDLYLAKDVIEHFPDPLATLKLWCDSLHGILLVRTPDRDDPRGRIRKMNPFHREITPAEVLKVIPKSKSKAKVKIFRMEGDVPHAFWIEIRSEAYSPPAWPPLAHRGSPISP